MSGIYSHNIPEDPDKMRIEVKHDPELVELKQAPWYFEIYNDETGELIWDSRNFIESVTNWSESYARSVADHYRKNVLPKRRKRALCQS